MTQLPRLFDRPLIILGCNRSGTTLLFNNLSQHPDTWSLYIESQVQFHRYFPVREAEGEQVSVAPPPQVAEALRRDLFEAAHNKEHFKDRRILQLLPRRLLQRPFRPLYRHPPVRFVDKTPANSLRVPLLAALFPDARFLFLVRRGEDVVSSLMEGWKNWSRRRLGDQPWRFTRWHYLVPAGWQAYIDRPLAEICAFQWIEANTRAWQDLNAHCPGRFLLLRHEDAMADPPAFYRRVLDFAELRPSRYFDGIIARIESRVFTTGGSAPRREKWRDLHGSEIEAVQSLLTPLNRQFYG